VIIVTLSQMQLNNRLAIGQAIMVLCVGNFQPLIIVRRFQIAPASLCIFNESNTYLCDTV